MPTVTLRPLLTLTEERGDLKFGRPRWAGEGGSPALLALPYNDRLGLNRYGRRTHATAPGHASAGDGAGYLQSGITWRVNTPLLSVTCNQSEGNHESTPVMVYQVPIAQGTTVTSATFVSTNSVAGSRGGAPGSVFNCRKDEIDKAAVKIFGVAEDNFVWQRVMDRQLGYNYQYWTEFNYKIPYRPFAGKTAKWQRGFNSRRYLTETKALDREHTNAAVAWEESGGTETYSVPWTSPNFATVVNEILARPGWVSGNRMALVLANDGMWNCIDPPNLLAHPPPPYSTYAWHQGDAPPSYGADEAIWDQALAIPWRWNTFANEAVQIQIRYAGPDHVNNYFRLVLTY